jgi:CheY-like chemotaxis protein
MQVELKTPCFSQIGYAPLQHKLHGRAEAVKGVEEADMSRENRMLLIVDSSASHRFYVGTMLRRLDYAVHGVASAEDAMQLMEDVLPSLVITGFELPEMDGISLLARMKRDQRLKAVPAIILSADDGPGMRDRCMNAGCVAYFKKPVEIGELYTTIQTVLETTPRHTVRIETAFRVKIGDKRGPEGAMRQETMTELSDGGLYIRTVTPEPVKTILPLTLFIEDRVINATAIVLYVSQNTRSQDQGPGMGMKFVTLDETDRVFIRDYIKKQISQGLSPSYD